MAVRRTHFMLTFAGFVVLAVSQDVDSEDKPLCCAKLSDGSFSNNCQRTRLWAGAKESYATTPNFPGRFPILKKCIWDIYTLPGRRIRLDFRDFYLIGPGDNGICYSQNVIIKSPLSGLQVGPHCGNAGIPSVISAGNYLVVELISNIPMTAENYRGFKMAFSESMETPNRALVSQHMKPDIIVSDGPSPVQRGIPKPTLAPTKTRSTTRKPSRVRFGNRFPSLAKPETANPVPGEGYIGSINPDIMPDWPKIPHDVQPPSSNELSPMVIVGIAAGGIVLLALSITLIMKCVSRLKKKQTNPSKGSTNFQKEKTQPPDIVKEQAPTKYYVYFYRERHKREGGKSKVSKPHEKKKSPSKKIQDKDYRKISETEKDKTSEDRTNSNNKTLQQRKSRDTKSQTGKSKKLTLSARKRQRDLAIVKKTKSICGVSAKTLTKNPVNRRPRHCAKVKNAKLETADAKKRHRKQRRTKHGLQSLKKKRITTDGLEKATERAHNPANVIETPVNTVTANG